MMGKQSGPIQLVRWFCGIDLMHKVPDHSTFSQNRKWRFKDAGIFRDIFIEIVRKCIELGLVSGETDRFVFRQKEYLGLQKLIYKKSTQNYYCLYSRSKKRCERCQYFSSGATDLGTVRLNASAYYPSFYRNNLKVGSNDYLRVMRLRQIWSEGTFSILKWEYKLNKIQKRGFQRATEEFLLSATA